MTQLVSSEQFRLAYREGRRASNVLFTIHARRNGLSQSRVGVAVPGRAGKAVHRNRIRRRIKAAFRSLPDVPAGIDLVVVGKAAARDAPFIDLLEAAQELVRRVTSERDRQ